MIIIAFALNFIVVFYGQSILMRSISLYKITPQKITKSKISNGIASAIGVVTPLVFLYVFWDSPIAFAFRKDSNIALSASWIFFTILIPIVVMFLFLSLAKAFEKVKSTASYLLGISASGAFSAIVILPLCSMCWVIFSGMFKAFVNQ